MLYDLDYGAKKVSSKDAENYEMIQIGKNRLNPRTFAKMIDTIDTALNNCKPSESSKLVWTSCAALIGYNSQEPTASTNHIWKYADEAFRGHSKSTHMFVGGLVRWRIALRAETWLCMRDEKDALDPETGKPIKIATYWVNENFSPAGGKPKAKGFMIADLASKFNRPLSV